MQAIDLSIKCHKYFQSRSSYVKVFNLLLAGKISAEDINKSAKSYEPVPYNPYDGLSAEGLRNHMILAQYDRVVGLGGSKEDGIRALLAMADALDSINGSNQ